MSESIVSRPVAQTVTADTLTDHGLIGYVRDIFPGSHSCDVHLSFVTESHRPAEQVATLLRSVLPSREYAVVGPEYGHHGLGRSVTVQTRSKRADVMGGTGMVHRVDAGQLTEDGQDLMVSRRSES